MNRTIQGEGLRARCEVLVRKWRQYVAIADTSIWHCPDELESALAAPSTPEFDWQAINDQFDRILAGQRELTPAEQKSLRAIYTKLGEAHIGTPDGKQDEGARLAEAMTVVREVAALAKHGMWPGPRFKAETAIALVDGEALLRQKGTEGERR